MKEDLQKAKALLAKGDVKGSLDILKALSSKIKGYISECPACKAEVAVIQKSGGEFAECPKCGAAWGKKDMSPSLLKYSKDMGDNPMDKKEILKSLWELYRVGDAEADAFSINHFELTGWLKKSLAVKLGLPIPGEEEIKKGECSECHKDPCECEKCEKCNMRKDMCKCMDKSEDGKLSKEDVLDVLLQMAKVGEERAYVNRHSIAKFEATGELSEDVLKMVYKKAGKDFYALNKRSVAAGEATNEVKAGDANTVPKKVDPSEGKNHLPIGMEDKKDLDAQHKGPLAPIAVKKG